MKKKKQENFLKSGYSGNHVFSVLLIVQLHNIGLSNEEIRRTAAALPTDLIFYMHLNVLFLNILQYILNSALTDLAKVVESYGTYGLVVL